MMKNIFAIIFVAFLIIGSLFLAGKNNSTTDRSDAYQAKNALANNVSVKDGRQIVEITARGGYQPRRSLAKAGLPTVIRFNTNGTFDCSASVRIPSLNISQNLPLSGVTDIDLGTPGAGTLNGSCGMGMYYFEIEFK